MGQLSMLIIPGASAVPEFYSPIISAVTAHGFDIKVLHIPSVGTPGPREGAPPTMYDDAAFISTHVKSLADAGKDIILITHSYGGVPGTQSVQGLSKKEREAHGLEGGIVGIAYITSLVPNLGEPAASVQAPMPEESKIPTNIDVRLYRHLCVRFAILGDANLKPNRKGDGFTTPIYRGWLLYLSQACQRKRVSTGRGSWLTTQHLALRAR